MFPIRWSWIQKTKLSSTICGRMFKLNYNSDGTSVEKYDITTYVLQYIYIIIILLNIQIYIIYRWTWLGLKITCRKIISQKSKEICHQSYNIILLTRVDYYIFHQWSAIEGKYFIKDINLMINTQLIKSKGYYPTCLVDTLWHIIFSPRFSRANVGTKIF